MKKNNSKNDNLKGIKTLVSSLLFPLISIIVAMFVAVIFVMWAKDISFIKGVQVMFKAIWNGSFGRRDNFIETLVYVIPLLFTGLANAVAFKTGLFNIGVEGEFMISITAGAIVGMIPGIPPVIHIILVLIAGTLAGIIWAGIPGYLKAKVGSNEVVNSIMMNYIALYFSNYLIMGPFNKKGLAQTPDIQPSAMLWRFLGNDYRLNIGLFIGLIMVVLVYLLFWKTTWGYEIRAVGLNQYAAEYGGINIKKNIIFAMAISGGIAGLGGAVYVSGIQHHAIQMVTFTGYGFDGIAVALLAKNNPIGVIFSALLFGALNTSSISLQMANIPKQIVFLIQAIILIFVAADYIYKWLAEKRRKGALMNE
ncbi:ABC transporter permease [Caloramator sp. E03]|uniref:ABC transporter permease n=1 Tax=Caloramator sp. E03 TaxID=2576307 RepID=UPI001110E5EC|nr:ABC transporter permease [Caloramator sp. E03]QCX34652.1 ABC transporter permease [Caloramator sp. E03]